jgi:hypothetical protein
MLLKTLATQMLEDVERIAVITTKTPGAPRTADGGGRRTDYGLHPPQAGEPQSLRATAGKLGVLSGR